VLCVSAGVTDLRLCFVRCRPFRTQTERWKRISSGARSCVRSGVRECIRRVGGAPRPSALSCGCVGVRAIDNALCHKKMHTAGTRRWILCDVFLYRGKPSIVVRVFPRLRVCNIDKSIGINHPPPKKKGVENSKCTGRSTRWVGNEQPTRRKREGRGRKPWKVHWRRRSRCMDVERKL